MKEFFQLAIGIAFLLIIWKGIRTIAKAIDYLANMKNNHDEVTDLLLEIRNELEKLNQKMLSNENSNDKVE
jgi:predicted PurR-regulated permease PerM